MARAIDRRILGLGIPGMVASLSVPLIGIVDTALVGHLPEVAYLGAVSAGSVIFDVLYWGLGFLRMGTTGLTAQYAGAGQRRDCTGVLLLAGGIAVISGLLLVAFRYQVAELGFYLAGGSDDVQMWGKAYLVVRILGAPMVLLTFVLTGFFRGLADAVTPMWLTILVNVVNVGADYVLIYGKFGFPEMGVVGAAWASVLATAVGLIYGLVVLGWRYRDFLAKRPAKLFDRDKLRVLWTTNVNLFGRTACLLFAQFFMLSQVARMGEVPLAAHAILMQLWALLSYFVDGLAHAAETLVGQALGGRDFDDARAIAKRCTLWGVGVSICFSLLYFWGMGPLVRVFTDHVPVIAAVVGVTFWASAVVPFNGAVYIWDGVFIGANDTRFLFGGMAIASFVCFLPAFLFFVHGLNMGLAGAWMGLNVLMVARFGVLAHRFWGEKWVRSTVEDI